MTASHTGAWSQRHRTFAENGEFSSASWRHYEPLRLPPVLHHSLEAFAEHGYHGTSVREIAKRLDQTVPTIYYHYENKQALLVSLLLGSLEDVHDRCHRADDEAGTDPVDRLRAVITCIVLYIANRRELAFLEGEILNLEPPSRTRCITMRDEIEGLVATAIADGAAQGRCTTPYPTDAARAILAGCIGIATWYRPDGPLSPEDLTERYVHFALGVVGHTAGG